MLTSELYKTRARADTASLRCRPIAAMPIATTVKEAANHQITGNSPMYVSAASRDKGIASAMSNGSNIAIKDLT